MKVLRDKQAKTLTVTVDELDLDAEQNRTQSRTNGNQPAPEDHGAGFGLTLQDLTAAVARRLQMPTGQSGAVITDVDPEQRIGDGRRAPGRRDSVGESQRRCRARPKRGASCRRFPRAGSRSCCSGATTG